MSAFAERLAARQSPAPARQFAHDAACVRQRRPLTHAEATADDATERCVAPPPPAFRDRRASAATAAEHIARLAALFADEAPGGGPPSAA